MSAWVGLWSPVKLPIHTGQCLKVYFYGLTGSHFQIALSRGNILWKCSRCTSVFLNFFDYPSFLHCNEMSNHSELLLNLFSTTPFSFIIHLRVRLVNKSSILNWKRWPKLSARIIRTVTHSIRISLLTGTDITPCSRPKLMYCQQKKFLEWIPICLSDNIIVS